jgi:hypothetical protein
MGNLLPPRFNRQVIAENEVPGLYSFDCQGCGHAHSFNTLQENEEKGFHTWEFNGDLINPTVSPSLLYHGGNMSRCHSHIINGDIQYIGDSTHSLSGTTVRLLPFTYMEETIEANL